MKHFKCIVASLLALVLLCGLIPAASAADTYEVTENGLTFRIENGEAELIELRLHNQSILYIPEFVDGCPVTKIGQNLCPSQVSWVRGIVIPGTVKTIGEDAFRYVDEVSTVFISEGVEEIGAGAFDIWQLTAITLPYSLKEIGAGAFYDSAMLYVGADTAAMQYAVEQGCRYTVRDTEDGSRIGVYASLCYTLRPDGTVMLTGQCGYPEPELPSVIEGYPVTAIGPRALYDYSGFDYIILPMFIHAIDSSFLFPYSEVLVLYYPTEFTRDYFANMPFYSCDIFLALERPFADVADDAWYFDAASFAYYFGLFNGTSDTEFSPEVPMTRAMLVTVLYRLDGGAAEGDIPFSDVPADEYYTDAVIWASENEIVNGVGSGRFDPDGLVTREQIATILYRYTERLTTPSSGAPLNGFPDVGNVSDFAKSAMQWAVGEKLIGGRTAGSVAYLSPKDGATRAEVAQILMRYVIGP